MKTLFMFLSWLLFFLCPILDPHVLQAKAQEISFKQGLKQKFLDKFSFVKKFTAEKESSPKTGLVCRPKERGGADDGRTFTVDSSILPRKEFEQIKDFSLEILKKFPPHKYIYVGLGRSPTPIIAFLQAYASMGPVFDIEAQNLPLSGFRPSLVSNTRKYNEAFKDLSNISFDEALSSQKKKRLFQHFDHFLGQKQESGGAKTILLIDYVESGRSLIAAHDHLEEYLAQKHRRKKDLNIEGLAVFQKFYGDRMARNPLRSFNGKKFHQMSLGEFVAKDDSFYEKIGRSFYDDLSEYTPYYPALSSQDPRSGAPVRREVYDRYVDKFKEYLRD